jgi:hypothetical protein
MGETRESDDPEWKKEFVIDHMRRFVNERDLTAAYDNFADNFIDHETRETPLTHEEIKVNMEDMYARFTDLHVDTLYIMAEGEFVTGRHLWSATNLDGSKIQFKGFVQWRIKDGEFVERWAVITPPIQVEENVPHW